MQPMSLSRSGSHSTNFIPNTINPGNMSPRVTTSLNPTNNILMNPANMSPRISGTIPMSLGNRSNFQQQQQQQQQQSVSYSMRASSIPHNNLNMNNNNVNNNGNNGIVGSFHGGRFDSPRVSFHRQDFGTAPGIPGFNLGSQLQQHQQQQQLIASNASINNNNNNNNATPPFSSRMSVSGKSVTGSVRNGIGNNMNHLTQPQLQISQSNATNNSQQQQQALPVIVPVQQDLPPEDPLLKSIEPALQSRVLMRSHYKSTGFCLVFIFVLFLILFPITYYIAWSTYKNELKSFTPEECTIGEIKRQEYEVKTVCGIATGYRFDIEVVFDGHTSKLCSDQPYACYNATATPIEPDPFMLTLDQGHNGDFSQSMESFDELYQNLVTKNIQKIENYDHNNNNNNKGVKQFNTFTISEQDNNGIVTHRKFNIDLLKTPSRSSSSLSQFTSLQSSDDPFKCTLCLRNRIDQCFSQISDSPEAYNHLHPGLKVPCYEYTDTINESDATNHNNGHDEKLIYRYFMGDPVELGGYPYIHSWWVFFMVGCIAFLLIAIYYLVKGGGICDVIDPEYWKRRENAKARAELTERQKIAKEKYLIKQQAMLASGNNNNNQNNNNDSYGPIQSQTLSISKNGGRSSTRSHRSHKNDQSTSANLLDNGDRSSLNINGLNNNSVDGANLQDLGNHGQDNHQQHVYVAPDMVSSAYQ